MAGKGTCPECQGKGFVLNGELAEFVEEVGPPAYYAAVMLANQEARLGEGRTLPMSAWEGIGISEMARTRLDDLQQAWPFWVCGLCSSQSHEEVTNQAFDTVMGVCRDVREGGEWWAR